MKIAFHPYLLESTLPLGARAQGTVREGALLRIEFPDVGSGYADLHPWTELGDLPLSQQLEMLRHGETTDLSGASLAFAEMDAGARAAERSLWDGLVIPPSHFLVPDFAEQGPRALDGALAEGFTHFKIKLGNNIAAEKQCLLELSSAFEGMRLTNDCQPRLRLDFNETLTPDQFARLFTGLEALGPFLDFIEDAIPYEPGQWAALSARSGIPFAVDRMSSDAIGDAQAIVIHKPARSGPACPNLSGRVIVTSYLDHPFGQLCAAWVAARVPGETHGLVSHRVYARNIFSARLGWNGPFLRLPSGHGFGFDEELAKLDWRVLP